MDRRIRSIAVALSAVAAAGCQTAQPPAPPPATQVSIAPMTRPVVEPPANPRADMATKLAVQQAASIDALLAARAAADRGVTVVEPPHVAPAAAPARTQPPAPVSDLRPVPPMNGDPAAAPPAETPPPAVVPPTAAPTASEPPRVTPSVAPPAAADPLGPRLAKHAAEVPRDLAAQLDAQLYQFAADSPVPTPESLAGLSGEDKNVLGSVLDGLSNFRTNVRNDSNLLIGDKIRPLLDMADRLRGQADLRVLNLTLCHAAPAFGVYDAIVPPRLIRGAPSQAFYYEIENFNPLLNEKGMYVTTLERVIVLYDKAGKSVWSLPKTILKDYCHVRRHDFFNAGVLHLPDLPAGSYRLKVTLNDAAAQRVGESGLTITITDPAAAAPVTRRPVDPQVVPPLFDR